MFFGRTSNIEFGDRFFKSFFGKLMESTQTLAAKENGGLKQFFGVL